VLGTQDLRLIIVFRPVVTGQNQTEHSVVQGVSSDHSPLPPTDLSYRRRRFFSRRGPCWRMNMAGTCRNSPARRLSSMQ